MSNIERPTLKLITKRDFETIKNKYGFINELVAKQCKKKITDAKPLDVLVLSVMPGSNLQILDIKIINEENEGVFLQVLKEGAVQPKP